MKKVIILGAGITGLSTAMFLAENNYDVILIEKNNKIEGVSSSFSYKNFTIDYGPHKIYTQFPNILFIIKKLLGENLLTIPKKSKIRLMNNYFNYPLDIKELLIKINPLTAFKLGLSYLKTTLKKSQSEKNYEEYLTKRFGKSIYSLVFENYAKKVWGDPKLLSADLAKSRVAIPNLIVMIKNLIIGTKDKPTISADEFYYPKKGIVQLSEAMAKKIKQRKGKIYFNSYPTKINIKNNKFTSLEVKIKNKKSVIKADYLISTLPINNVPKLVNAPSNIKDSANLLKNRSILLFYLFLDKDRAIKDNWIFFPEGKFIFNRISEQKSFSPFIAPKDKTFLTIEITYDKDSEISKLNKDSILKILLPQLKEIGVVKSEKEIINTLVVKLTDIYPVYDLDYKKNLNNILTYLDGIENFLTIGRQGLFNYNNMDHCMDMADRVVRFIKSKGTKEEWIKLRKVFDSYKIVD